MLVFAHGPVVRRVLPAPHLKRGAVGGYRLLQTFCLAFALAQGREGIAEVCFASWPSRTARSLEFVPQAWHGRWLSPLPGDRSRFHARPRPIGHCRGWFASWPSHTAYPPEFVPQAWHGRWLSPLPGDRSRFHARPRPKGHCRGWFASWPSSTARPSESIPQSAAR